MHPSSFDKMAAFRRNHLDSRQNEPLLIVDLGSHDINGSYRSLFDKPPWHYLGADLAPGDNVDLVLRDPYDWRELKTGSVDIVISGQTLEHTEFFWETMFEIARVLKPHGLCCIIAPSSGPEHRFPIDCWRFYPDGLRAVARYAGLEVVEARTQWNDLEQYDSESNKWHESVLVARKRPEGLSKKWRRRLRAPLKRFLSLGDWKPETVVQVFYSDDGNLSEANSACASVSHDTWQNVCIPLPKEAGCTPLRIDFNTLFKFVDLVSICVKTPQKAIFHAQNIRDFDSVRVAGDAERVPHSEFFRLKITGLDPQLWLPSVETGPDDRPLIVEMRLRTHANTVPPVR
ncbi:MAG: hypothetical protein QOI22_1826 [Verrucomicrobiota bacterium]